MNRLKKLFMSDLKVYYVDCPHLKRRIQISNNPVHNECVTCWDEYQGKLNERLT